MDRSGRVYDELLVLHVQNGDRRALERLASRWHPRLLRSARRFTGDDELAREAVQEAWLGIVAGLKKLGDPAKFPAWAFTILRRRCADRIRAHAAHRPRSDELTEANAPVISPRGEDQAAIAEAFGRLPDDQRIAATLYFVERLKLDEIAAATGVPLGTVKSRIFTARKTLKTLLEGEDR